MTNNNTNNAAANIDRLAAQDAYGYAECCAKNGDGETFQAGKVRGTCHVGTLAEAWRLALDAAKRANVNLSGLSLRAGTIAVRGEALRLRVKEESARQGIVAELGETIRDYALESGDSPAQIAHTYNIFTLVPEEILKSDPNDKSAPAAAPAADVEPALSGTIDPRPTVTVDMSETLAWLERLPEVSERVKRHFYAERRALDVLQHALEDLREIREKGAKDAAAYWTPEEIATAKG